MQSYGYNYIYNLSKKSVLEFRRINYCNLFEVTNVIEFRICFRILEDFSYKLFIYLKINAKTRIEKMLAQVISGIF